MAGPWEKYGTGGPRVEPAQQAMDGPWSKYGKGGPRQDAPRKKDERPASFIQGAKKGVMTPWNNAARLLEYGAEKIGVADAMNKFGKSLGTAGSVAEAEKVQQKSLDKSQYRPSTVGEFVGNMAGTLPTLALPGGPFAQGAYTTGLLTDSREPDKILAEMAVGGLIGKGADKAVKGIASKVAPKVSKTIGDLAKRDVQLTPGQAMRESKGVLGRAVSAFEDRGSSLPGPTGQAIRAGQQRSSESFVKGAVNESLGELGTSLPKNIGAGHEAIAFAQKAAGNAYDDALRGMQLIPDEQLVGDINNVVRSVNNGGVTEGHAKQFSKLVNDVVLRRTQANGGNLSGDNLKTVLSELNQKASKYARSSVASEQEYGDAISALADALEQGARRSSAPEYVAALDAADRAYAKLVRIEGAAKNASGGIFTPGQLETAVRQADNSVRKRAIARGGGLMQDYAAAGRAILPQKIGDSGTAGREAVWSIPAWLVDLAAYAPYKAAEATLPRAATRTPGPTAQTIGELLDRSAPAISKTAPVVGYGLASER